MKRALSSFFPLFVFSLMAAAQSHYVATTNYGLANNISNCYANNCFLLTNGVSGGGGALLAQISSGYDLSVFGIDPYGNIWKLPLATSSKPLWTLAGMNSIGGTNYPAKWIAVRSASEIYAGFMTTCGAVPQVYR